MYVSHQEESSPSSPEKSNVNVEQHRTKYLGLRKVACRCSGAAIPA